jgi:hypothetical protein
MVTGLAQFSPTNAAAPAALQRTWIGCDAGLKPPPPGIRP